MFKAQIEEGFALIRELIQALKEHTEELRRHRTNA